jgi:hypothetical protein
VKAFINMSQMTLSEMSITETTASLAAQAAVACRAGAELVRSAGSARAADSVSKASFLNFTSESVANSNQIRLPFGEARLRRSQGKTLPGWSRRCSSIRSRTSARSIN